VIQIAQPVQTRQRLAARAALRSVAPLLLIAPAMALVVWWLAAQSLAPLRRLTDAVRRRDASSLQPLSQRSLPLEVAPLVGALNDLLRRLGASVDTQRAFVADAAHELRSPLTALKLQLQWLKRAPDAADQAAALDAMSAGIDRAARLVEQLLTLARAEPGTPLPQPVELDLAEVVRTAVRETAALAQERGSAVTLDASAPVHVRGDPALLTVLVRNLVDNALRHSPPAGRVQLQLQARAQWACLEVDDAGPGIPAPERERVFDRFYRRARDGESGTGLGLAIVRSVAQRHGARLSLGESALGGLRVSLQVPLGESAGPGPRAVGSAALEATP
jgi:two-component system OmpR family sensor kinase/two-component system sensor histidine kinase QseC